jgi:uncharacterized protein (TIGR02118 family)
MIKTILFVKRRADLTHEEFRAYYENNHAPLAISVLPWLRRYVRNYFPQAGEAWSYDVATEFWFENAEGQAATMAFAASPEGKILEEDEARFMDRPTMLAYTVDEDESDLSDRADEPLR